MTFSSSGTPEFWAAYYNLPGIHYRAIGKFVKDGFLWQWIGSHVDYDRMA